MTKKRYTSSKKFSLYILLFFAVILFIFFSFLSRTVGKPTAPKISDSFNNKYLYETRNGIFSAKIGAKDTSAPFIIFNTNNSSASFVLDSGQSQKISESNNKVVFEKVKENTDFVYQTLPNGIKEEIVLSAPVKDKEFIFTLTTVNAQPRKIGTDAYSPFFFDSKNNYQFHIEKPFAIDAKGVRTEDIALSIRKSKANDNTYEIKLTLPENWLKDKSRSYPVIVDPTIIHDTTAEFATGIFNRIKDTPSLQIVSVATGGTVSFSGAYTIHTFTGNGTFTPSQNLTVDVQVLGGGAGGSNGGNYGGGGGAGQLVTQTGLSVTTGTNYAITVGTGGGAAANGNPSTIGTLAVTANGGQTGSATTGGTSGNSFAGGTGSNSGANVGGGGGGGSSAIGGNSTATNVGGTGGAGTLMYDGVTRAGGGGGAGGTTSGTGTAGGGNGGNNGGGSLNGSSATANTGSGGGGAVNATAGSGGSGIVIIRYLTQYTATGVGLSSYYQELNTDSHTVGLYHLNDVSGNATDSSGNGNTGIPTGTTINTTSPFLGAASRSFSGSGNYITIPTASVDTSTGGFNTVEFWMNWDGNAPRMVFGWNQYDLYIQNSSCFGFNTANGEVLGTTSTIPANQWVHVAAIFPNGTPSTSNAKLYINGIEQSLSFCLGTSSLSKTPSASARISGWTTDTAQFFTGQIDELRISNVARSLEEIRLDAQRRPYGIFTSDLIDFGQKITSWNSLSWIENGVTTGDGETISSNQNLIAQWNFNETSGTTASVAAGSCGSICNATLTNMTTSGQDAATMSGWTSNNRRWGAGALMFDNIDDYAISTYNAAQDPTSANITVEAWVNPARMEALDRIVGTAASNKGWRIRLASTGPSGLEMYIGDGSTYHSCIKANQMNPGNWYFVAATFDGSTFNLYVNGKNIGSCSDTFTPNYASLNGIAFGGAPEYWMGDIDSVRLYNRVLSSSEILSNYNNGNIEFQTRVGTTTSPDDGTWEEWRPITNEAIIDNMDNPLDYATPSASIFVGAVVATSSSTFPRIEGTAALKIQTGQLPNSPNTKGYWHLDETSGTGAYIKDSSGNGNDGTPTSTTVANGIVGKARKFSGTSQYITIPDTASDDILGAETIEAWVRQDAARGESIISKDTDASNRSFNFYTDASGTLVCLFINGATYIGRTTAAGALKNNVFSHVACTYDGTTSAAGVKIYVNGVQSDTTNATGGTFTGRVDSNAVITIGHNIFGATLDFTGIIDEVRISNIVRSQEEIAEEFRLGQNHYINKILPSLNLSAKNTLPFYIAADRPGTYLKATIGNSAFANYQTDSNTVGFWHLSEKSGLGAYIRDSSGNGNSGTPTGTTFSPGIIGNARIFNGTSDFINVSANATLDLTTNYTLEAWIYPTTSGNSIYRVILGKRTTGAAANYQLYLNNDAGANAGVLRFYNGTEYVTGFIPPVNKWTYIVAVVSGTTNLTIYVNGHSIYTTTIAASVANAGSFAIGRAGDLVSAATYFQGLIDEVRLSNTARSASDIRQAYEQSTRSHDITIDFAASLDAGNSIADSNDKSFTIDATTQGLNFKGSNLYKGDKIIVKENVDGTEYIAQGTVDSINLSTGATTVAVWDTGSSIPVGGFTANATVFKWQREYFDITAPLDSQINAVTNLTFRITNGQEGRNIWIDDLRSNTDYMTNYTSSSITSSIGKRYFQYRAIIDPNDTSVSPFLSAVTIDYVPNTTPATPTLDSPSNTATGVALSPQLKTTTTDADNDYIEYKIQMCSNPGMTLNCQTFDQTSSQTGWSNKDANGNTAYSSGHQAIYTIQSPLPPNTVYYWRSYAIDPNGTNTWSGTQASPFSFTTNAIPNTPSLDQPGNGAGNISTTTVFKTTTTDIDSDYLKYKIDLCTNESMTINCQTFNQVSSGTGWSGMDAQSDTAYASGTQATYTVQTPLTLNTTYFWRSYAVDPAGTNTFSGTQLSPFSFTTVSGPPQPSECTASINIAHTQITVRWVDNATSENGYQIWRIKNGAAPVQLGSNLPANTVSYLDTDVSNGNSYSYKIRDFQFDGAETHYSNWCTTSTITPNIGNFRFEGIQFN